MKKILLTIALVLLSGATMAKEERDGRLTADELNAKTAKTAILIRCTQVDNNNTYYNQTGGRTALAENSIVYWVPAGDGAFYITKGDGENDYLQNNNITTFGTVNNAAKFHAVKPTTTNTGNKVSYTDGANIYTTQEEGGEYWVRLAFTNDSKWFNFNGSQYNTGTGVWTVQNVYEVAFVTYNLTLNGETKLTKTVPVIVGQDFPELPELPFGCTATATKPEGKVPAGNTTQNIEVTVSLPFEYANSYDNINNWYYLKIKNANYLYHVEGQDYIALDKTSVAYDNKSAYSWAFIGNPFDGFQIVNMAVGEGYILSSSTVMEGTNGGSTYPKMTATPIAEGNNVLWVLSSSSYVANGFFAEQKGFSSNKMNNRDNKLAYWTGGADVGSTFTVEERPSAVTELRALYEQAKVLLEQAVIGNTLGQYSTTYEDYEGYEEIFDEITIIIEEDEIDYSTAEYYAVILTEIINSFSLNMPEEGKYYRFKSVDDTFLTAPKSTGVSMNLSNEATERSILYLDADGRLLVYGSGMYINGKNHAHMGYKANYAIEASKTGAIGYYAIKPSSANYWYANGENLDVYSNGTHENCNWTIEEVESLPVSISTAKYATFYAPVAVKVADGITAYTVSINEGGWADLNEIKGGVIPANTGVVLYSENAGTYNFTITDDVKAIEGNALRGSAAATYYTTAGTYYALALVDGEVGFYKDKFNNDRFQNNSHKAYLYVPAANGAASYSFRFGEGTTGIEQITDNREQSTVIYDLTGRRVEAITAPGIYIVNGKKVLVK